MKRVKFTQHLNTYGCGFVKHGSRHDKYRNHLNGKCTYVPRHSDWKNFKIIMGIGVVPVPVPVPVPSVSLNKGNISLLVEKIGG